MFDVLILAMSEEISDEHFSSPMVDDMRARMGTGQFKHKDQRGTPRSHTIMEPGHRCTSASCHPR